MLRGVRTLTFVLPREQKEKVKEIGAPRHKLVVQVTIGEVQGQGVRIASRCLWDVETDNHASAYYTNPYCESLLSSYARPWTSWLCSDCGVTLRGGMCLSLAVYCVAMVFACYYE